MWFPPPWEDPHARSTLGWAERGQSAGRVSWGWLLEQGPSGRQGRRLGQQQALTWQPGHHAGVAADLQHGSGRTCPGDVKRIWL